MKIDFKRLNELLEAKASRAIDRLDGLKCYTDEFADTLDSIVYMLEVSKELEQYDTECPDCKHRNEQPQGPQQPEYIGKTYKAFDIAKDGLDRIVLFYSNGCEPCQFLKPILEHFVLENNLELELVLVDNEEGLKHAQEYQIQGWPTIFGIKSNKIAYVTFGADYNAPVEETVKRLTNEILPFFIREEV